MGFSLIFPPCKLALDIFSQSLPHLCDYVLAVHFPNFIKIIRKHSYRLKCKFAMLNCGYGNKEVILLYCDIGVGGEFALLLPGD